MNINNYYFQDYPKFKPCFSPKEMLDLGIFGGIYFQDYPKNGFLYNTDLFKDIDNSKLFLTEYNKSKNYYNIKASMSKDDWANCNWLDKNSPLGWYEWYCNFFYGKRTSDDIRQINRWSSFTSRMYGILRPKTLDEKKDLTTYPKLKQSLLHWSWNPIIDPKENNNINPIINNNLYVELDIKSDKKITF